MENSKPKTIEIPEEMLEDILTSIKVMFNTINNLRIAKPELFNESLEDFKADKHAFRMEAKREILAMKSHRNAEESE